MTLKEASLCWRAFYAFVPQFKESADVKSDDWLYSFHLITMSIKAKWGTGEETSIDPTVQNEVALVQSGKMFLE